MLFLNVPYEEKDKAKALGAKWNPSAKKWYVEKKEDYPKFWDWILNDGLIVVCDHIYLLEGKRNCFKCGKETKVIGFGVEEFFLWDDYDDNDNPLYEYRNENEINIVGTIDNLPHYILEYVQSKYNYKMKYSNTTKQTAMSNCCEHCNSLQGSFFLFEEVDSPFFIDSIEAVKRLKIYKIPLKTDLILNEGIGFGSNDWMLKEEGNIEDLLL